jgi:hypothetical protein
MMNLIVESTSQMRSETTPSRVLVVGEAVIVVQQVSRYCLSQGADVLPFYGLPDAAAVTLFDPHLLVLCLPLAESFIAQLDRPYLLLAEPSNQDPLPISSQVVLAAQLRAILPQLN